MKNNPISHFSFNQFTLINKFCLFSVLLLFFVYNLTICPDIYWIDSAELVNTAFTLGIGHPAGFPAYSLISKIITFLPFSSIAVKVNFASLLFAILTVILTFLVIIDLIKLCFRELKNELAYLSATLSVLILGFASSFWWMAIVPELYTLNCFFMSAFFLVVLKWYQSRETKLLFLASFLLGISAAVYGASLLFLPAIIASYLLSKDKKPFNKLLLASAFFLLGYSIYIYLPVRSLSNPPFDWGNTETFTRFVSHITDQKDSSEHFKNVISLFSLYINSGKFLKITIKELTSIGLFFSIVGIICNFQKNKNSFFLLAPIAIVNTLFFMTENRGYLFLVSFLIFTFWIGLGIYVLIAESKGYIFNFNYKNLILPLIIVSVIFSLFKDYVYNDKSSYYLPRDHSLEMYSNVEQNAVIFSYQTFFHFRFFKDIEFFRPDVTIIFLSDLVRPDLFDPVNQKRFPMITFPEIESKRRNQHKFIQSIISKNISQRPIYWDFKADLTKYNYLYLVPDNKFLMRFVGHKVEKISRDLMEKYFNELRNSMLKELSDEHFFLDHKMGVRGYYYIFLNDFADYLMMRKMYQNAMPFLELAGFVTDQGNEDILNKKGLCLIHLGKLKKAEEIFIRLYDKNREHYGYNHNLALLYFHQRKPDKAKFYAKNVISLNKEFNKGHFLLGLIYEKEMNFDQAIEEITYALENTDFLPDKDQMQVALDRVKKSKTGL